MVIMVINPASRIKSGSGGGEVADKSYLYPLVGEGRRDAGRRDAGRRKREETHVCLFLSMKQIVPKNIKWD